MPWQPALNALRDALAELHPTQADWHTLVASAGLDSTRIRFDARMANTWHATLEEAENQGRTEALIGVAMQDYPRNRKLLAAVAAYRAGAGAPESSTTPGAAVVGQPEPQVPPSSPITWLHLSDFHFAAQEQDKWQANVVLRPLLDDVQCLLEKEQVSLDVILVSGDIAAKGAPKEYDLAAAFLDELLARTGVLKEHLLLVPGNHDVERGAISRGARSIAASLDSREALDEVLASAEDRSRWIWTVAGCACSASTLRSWLTAARKTTASWPWGRSACASCWRRRTTPTCASR
jgi:hypothetical protein